MRLSDSTFLYTENDLSTSQEVIGAYLNEEIWDKVRSNVCFLHFGHK